MHTQSHPQSHTEPVSLTRTWDTMLCAPSTDVHLTRASDPTTITSTSVLLDRTPLVEGREPMLRDTLLVLTTVHRDGTYQSLAGVIVHQQFTHRTVFLMPRTMTALCSHADDFTGNGLTVAHENALDILAARYRDEPGFRDRFTTAV